VDRLPADLGQRRSADERADQPDRRLKGYAGTGTLSAAIGLTVALSILLATVLVLARLHRTTAVSAAAADAAHLVAEAGPGPAPRAEAELTVRTALGERARISWEGDEMSVRITVTVPSPPVPGLPGTIRRTAAARWERPR
jgi:hypothetical protein